MKWITVWANSEIQKRTTKSCPIRTRRYRARIPRCLFGIQRQTLRHGVEQGCCKWDGRFIRRFRWAYFNSAYDLLGSNRHLFVHWGVLVQSLGGLGAIVVCVLLLRYHFDNRIRRSRSWLNGCRSRTETFGERSVAHFICCLEWPCYPCHSIWYRMKSPPNLNPSVRNSVYWTRHKFQTV